MVKSPALPVLLVAVVNPVGIALIAKASRSLGVGINGSVSLPTMSTDSALTVKFPLLPLLPLKVTVAAPARLRDSWFWAWFRILKVLVLMLKSPESPGPVVTVAKPDPLKTLNSRSTKLELVKFVTNSPKLLKPDPSVLINVTDSGALTIKFPPTPAPVVTVTTPESSSKKLLPLLRVILPPSIPAEAMKEPGLRVMLLSAKNVTSPPLPEKGLNGLLFGIAMVLTIPLRVMLPRESIVTDPPLDSSPF